MCDTIVSLRERDLCMLNQQQKFVAEFNSIKNQLRSLEEIENGNQIQNRDIKNQEAILSSLSGIQKNLEYFVKKPDYINLPQSEKQELNNLLDVYERKEAEGGLSLYEKQKLDELRDRIYTYNMAKAQGNNNEVKDDIEEYEEDTKDDDGKSYSTKGFNTLFKKIGASNSLIQTLQGSKPWINLYKNNELIDEFNNLMNKTNKNGLPKYQQGLFDRLRMNGARGKQHSMKKEKEELDKVAKLTFPKHGVIQGNYDNNKSDDNPFSVSPSNKNVSQPIAEKVSQLSNSLSSSRASSRASSRNSSPKVSPRATSSSSSSAEAIAINSDGKSEPVITNLQPEPNEKAKAGTQKARGLKAKQLIVDAKGNFGKIKIDMNLLKRNKLKAWKNGKIKIPIQDIPYELSQLLMKRSPSKSIHADIAKLWKELLAVAELDDTTSMRSKKQQVLVGKGVSSKIEYKYYSNPNELVKRLQTLKSAKKVGNDSQEIRNEINAILDQLKGKGLISKTQYKNNIVS